MRWQQKKNRDGDLVPGCWVTECGYKVARCMIGARAVFIVTAPSARKPMAYCRDRDEVISAIKEHRIDVAI